MLHRAGRTAVVLVLLLVAGAIAAAPAPVKKPNPILVLGFDGMEWSIADTLEAQGLMPNLKALRARGVEAKMATDYEARSPIVWTTMATGMNKEVHGIEDFAVSTPTGPSAITSTLRKVPAIWNMVSAAGRKVAVMGFWGTYPAEPDVNGVIISDRAAHSTTGAVVSADYKSTFLTEIVKANADRSLFPVDEHVGAEDRMVSYFAPLLVSQHSFDLVIAYLRGIDLVSHEFWKYWEPAGFPAIDPAAMAKYKDMIPGKYRAMDAVIGRVLAVTPKNTNIFVLSDHGFRALHPELIMVRLNLPMLLQKTGLLVADDKGVVDYAKSKFYGFQAQDHRTIKFVRYSMAGRDPGGTITPDTQAAARAELTADLAKFTWADGKSPVFLVRDMTAAEKADVATGGADLAVVVDQDNATNDVLYGTEKITGAVTELTYRSGVHNMNPPAVFIAAGPDIDTKADLTGIRVHDITPTLLCGMGLPVGDDMNGKPQTQLYTKAFLAAHPLLHVPTYGKIGVTSATKSAEDEALLDQLRKLGYIQ